jgi:hypothetical protein
MIKRRTSEGILNSIGCFIAAVSAKSLLNKKADKTWNDWWGRAKAESYYVGDIAES